MSFHRISSLTFVVSALLVVPAAAQQPVVPAAQAAEAPVNAPLRLDIPESESSTERGPALDGRG